MFFSRLLATLVVLPLVGAAACSSSNHKMGPAEPPSGTLVVGIEADDFGSIVSSVHVVVKEDGVVVHEETVPFVTGSPTPFAKEIPITGTPGARIDVEADALSTTPNAAPIVSRLASGHIVGGAKKLLRVYLEGKCVLLPASASSGVFGVSCTAPQTCIGGVCGSGDVADINLEDYDPNWGVAPPDICRPANHGAPIVTLGVGQTDYGVLSDGQTLQLEAGPQGGHHLWIAVRMKNLRQSGTTTTITSTLIGDPTAVPSTAFVFTFTPDEGSYCKEYGLRYALDAGATDLGNAYKRFLGKQLAVTVELADSTGATASSTRTVQIADTLLCPDGTDGGACSTN